MAVNQLKRENVDSFSDMQRAKSQQMVHDLSKHTDNGPIDHTKAQVKSIIKLRLHFHASLIRKYDDAIDIKRKRQAA